MNENTPHPNKTGLIDARGAYKELDRQRRIAKKSMPAVRAQVVLTPAERDQEYKRLRKAWRWRYLVNFVMFVIWCGMALSLTTRPANLGASLMVAVTALLFLACAFRLKMVYCEDIERYLTPERRAIRALTDIGIAAGMVYGGHQIHKRIDDL